MTEPRLYRGVTKAGNWVKGDYFAMEDCVFIVPDSAGLIEKDDEWMLQGFIEVISETVGQSTGLKDKKRTEKFPEGQEIFQGDKVTNAKGNPYEVVYGPDIKTNPPNYTGWIMRSENLENCDYGANELFEWNKDSVEVIGSIHDHLLKGAE